MARQLELKLVSELPTQHPLLRKSLEQLIYEKAHYQALYWGAKGRSRRVIGIQLHKLNKLIIIFQSEHKLAA